MARQKADSLNIKCIDTGDEDSIYQPIEMVSLFKTTHESMAMGSYIAGSLEVKVQYAHRTLGQNCVVS